LRAVNAVVLIDLLMVLSRTERRLASLFNVAASGAKSRRASILFGTASGVAPLTNAHYLADKRTATGTRTELSRKLTRQDQRLALPVKWLLVSQQGLPMKRIIIAIAIAMTASAQTTYRRVGLPHRPRAKRAK
jgi:hypothetical protein